MPAWWRKVSPLHWLWLVVAALAVLALWLLKSLWAVNGRLAVERDLATIEERYKAETAEADKLTHGELSKIQADYLVKVAMIEAEREHIDEAASKGRQAMAHLWNETMRPGSGSGD